MKERDNRLRHEVTKAMAQLVRHGHKGQVRFEQQHILEETEGQGNLRSSDDEALLVMIRMGIRDGSLCDDKVRFVFQDEADETSCIANKRRALEETSKGRFEHSAASSDTFREAESQSRIESGKSNPSWSSSWWRSSWNSGSDWNSWKDSPSNRWKKHGKGRKAAWHEEGDAESTTEEISNVVVETLWQRVEPRPSVPELLEVEQCNNEECTIRHLQFQTTQLLFEVHLDLEGGRTKAICLDGSERKEEAIGRVNSKTPSTLRCVQAPKKTTTGGSK